MSAGDATTRRILLALDAASRSAASFEAAADLAERMRAELLCVFVEDLNLLRVAGLPFTRQLSLPAAIDEHFDTSSVERELRRLAAEAERRLAVAAERRRLAWSFRVARGLPAETVATAAEGVDLLIVQRSSRPPASFLRLGDPARDVVLRARRSVALLPAASRPDGPVIAVYDGSDSADAALAAALSLAENAGAGRGTLEVLVCADTDAHAEQLRQTAAARLAQIAPADVRARVGKVVPGTLPRLRAVLHAAAPGVLALGATGALAGSGDLHDLADQLECPVLIAR